MKLWVIFIAAYFVGMLMGATVLAGETSVSIGAGYNGNFTGSSIEWDDAGGIGAYFQLAHEWDIDDNWSVVAHYTHLSQWDVGKPFNDTPESSVDHVGVAIKWTF